MNYELPDSSGTDDDLPPHQRRFANVGRALANGRPAAVGTAPFPPIQIDMEAQIHQIEQEAYSSVLRAFKAQSDAITWEKESLITELRKELRVSDEEHRELLEWRAGGCQPSIRNSMPIHDALPSLTVSASRKNQNTSQSVASLSIRPPSQVFHTSMQPSPLSLKQGPGSGGRGRKPKPHSTGFPGRGPAPGRGFEGSFGVNDSGREANFDPLVGRKVWTRWPEDNSFYEAVITDYNSAEGRHALVYDINTADETWEWVNIKEISPEDIRWEGEDPGIAHRGGRNGSGRGFKSSMSRGGSFAVGRGRGLARRQAQRDFPLAVNGIGKNALGDIEILHTDTLVKEVEKVFGASNPNRTDIEKAKKVLMEHEKALIDAIARLEGASDGEDRRERQFPQGKSMDQERGQETTLWQQDGRVLVGSDGTKLAGEPRTLSDSRAHCGM